MPSSNRQRVPLYQKVERDLRNFIAQHFQPGDRLPSENLLAAKFNVSVLTLRQAMAVLVGEGFLQRRQGSGTLVTRLPEFSLQPGRHVAILLEARPEEQRISSHHLQGTYALVQGLAESGYPSQVYMGIGDVNDPCAKPHYPGLREAIHEGYVVGVALFTGFVDSTLLGLFRRQNLPVVGKSYASTYYVRTQQQTMVEEAVRFLVGAGRRRIAIMEYHGVWPAPPNNSDRRVAHFKRVMESLGLCVTPKWIKRDLRPVLPGAGWEGFREIWRASREKPDGLIVIDDLLFRDAAPAILGDGIRVPEDLMVVTHGNADDPPSSPFPVRMMLTSSRRMGFGVAGLLKDLLAGREPPDPSPSVAVEMLDYRPDQPIPFSFAHV